MRLDRKGHIETFVVMWLTGLVSCLLLFPLNHLLRERHYSRWQIVLYEVLMVVILGVIFNIIVWFPWGALKKKPNESAKLLDGQNKEIKREE